MTFVGNKKTLNLLQKGIQNGAIAQSYLFSGPEQVGKHTLAKIFAQHLINGSQLTDDVQYSDKDALLDLIMLEPEVAQKNGVKKQRDISVEAVRDAKQGLSLFPYKGKYKVLIINDAHRMNVAAQNALLKILEEPNETSILILVTKEVDRILPTILSRVQMVNFGLVSDSEMVAGFAGEPAIDEKIIALSSGRPGLASMLSQDSDEREFRVQSLDELDRVTKGSLNDKFKFAEELSKDMVHTLGKMNVWMWEMRKRALMSDEMQRNQTYQNLEKMQKSMELLKRTNANSRLLLEALLMDM